MVILEQNFKWHLEAFASELFIYKKSVEPYFSSLVTCQTLYAQYDINVLVS